MSVTLITGAAGFVGSYLLEHLHGGEDVVAWTRSEPPPHLVTHARWMRVDVRQRDEVREALRQLQPRSVYHCAGFTHTGRSWISPVEALEVNVLATHHLLDGLRRTGAPCRVLVTGSAAVYAASPDPLTESSPLAPDSPYALSKLAQEMLALRSNEEDGLEVIMTRSFNHTGPRQVPDYVAPSIARQIALIERGRQAPVVRVGNLDVRRDITDVRDVARAYAALMAHGAPGEVYNVASGVGHSIRELIASLTAAASVAVRLEVEPDRIRPTDNPILVGDASRLRQRTGWAPAVPFPALMASLLDYWRQTV